MIKLSLQSDIDERTDRAIESLHQMHDMGVTLHLYAIQYGMVHIDQLKAEAESLGYDFVDEEYFFGFRMG